MILISCLFRFVYILYRDKSLGVNGRKLICFMIKCTSKDQIDQIASFAVRYFAIRTAQPNRC